MMGHEHSCEGELLGAFVAEHLPIAAASFRSLALPLSVWALRWEGNKGLVGAACVAHAMFNM